MSDLRSERLKYELIWRQEGYGRRSPGLQAAPAALPWAEELGAESLMDWGCGDGQAMAWFEEEGLSVTGFDLVDIHRESAGPFVRGTLWDPPPELPTADFAFSADVLEHLPTEHVEASLAVIRRHTRLGGFLQVCTVPDNWGRAIGETLHLTVRRAGWWLRAIDRHFEIADVVTTKRWVRAWLKT